MLPTSDMYSLALEIATKAHAGQLDKGGRPYIGHPVAVAAQMSTEEEKAAALLHDVIEDTPVTLEELSAAGFSDGVLEAVRLLAKKDGEPYHGYLGRVAENPVAKAVKIADARHNMDISRIPSPTPKDIARLDKYADALAFLEKI